MKKNGGFIPGIRPGSAHQRLYHQSGKQNHTGWRNLLRNPAMVPVALQWIFKVNVGFGGTTLIIVVGVTLDIVKALESQLLMRHYKGFLSE